MCTQHFCIPSTFPTTPSPLPSVDDDEDPIRRGTLSSSAHNRSYVDLMSEQVELFANVTRCTLLAALSSASFQTLVVLAVYGFFFFFFFLFIFWFASLRQILLLRYGSMTDFNLIESRMLVCIYEYDFGHHGRYDRGEERGVEGVVDFDVFLTNRSHSLCGGTTQHYFSFNQPNHRRRHFAKRK